MTNPRETKSVPRSAGRRVGRLARRLLRAAPEQHGDGLIETAVTLPLFLLIFFGIAQYAVVLFAYCNATYACRLASRYASIHSTSSLAPDTVSQIQNLVTARLFLSPAITPTVNVNCYTQAFAQVSCTGGNVVGNIVQVSVTWNQTMKLLARTSSTFSVSTQNYKVITR